MLDEPRTVMISTRVRPSISAAIQEDRMAKGQSYAEWFERTVRTVLAMPDDRSASQKE